MVESIALIDHYENTSHRKVYTFKELGIPGLSVLGWNHSNRALDTVSCHHHLDCVEIKFLVQGKIVIYVNGKDYYFNGNEIFITPANMPHDSGTHIMGKYEMYWIQLRIDKPPFLFLEKEWAAELQRLLGNLKAGVLRGMDLSRKYLGELFSLLVSDSVTDKYQGVSQLVNILHGMIRTRLDVQDYPQADIQKAIDFIKANIYDEIALESLADAACLSLSRFNQKFIKQIGMPPRMFINEQKMEKAQELLAAGKSVTDTAFDLGFNSSTYFSTVFRKFTCLSPSEFVRKKGEQYQILRSLRD